MDPIITQEELLRQVQLHVESLKRAGVDYLPAGPALHWKQPAPAMPAAQPKPPARTTAPPETVALPMPAVPAQPAPLPVPTTTSTSPMQEAPMANKAAQGPTLEQRVQSLELLAQEVSKCTLCPELCSTRTQTVFGSGRPGVELCFIGEAPGADEDLQGKPFVGASGKLLTKIIEGGCGLKREDVYICNILRCRPPGNRQPQPSEAANCRDFLLRTLRLVQPKFICTLGSCAATNLLGTTLSLGKLRGKFHDFEGTPVLCTYHPSYLLRFPEMKREVWEDMKILLKRMGLPIPTVKSKAAD